MRKIGGLRVTQIRVFARDVLPLPEICSASGRDRLRGAFSFQRDAAPLGHPAPQQEEPMAFLDGEFRSNGKLRTIEHVFVFSQRVQLTVLGSSKDADTFFEAFKKEVRSLAGDKARSLDPLVKTEQTACSVTLNVDFEDLFSPDYLAFLRDKLRPATSRREATSEVRPKHLVADVSYNLEDKTLAGHQVTVVSKIFVIEPRSGTPLEEKRFFTSSPTDSDTHLKLLREFERAFKKPPARKS